LIAWDDLGEGSTVKWGLFDLSTRTLKLLGTQHQASYPIIASSGNRITLVALQPDGAKLFRTAQTSKF
jgi:hypothetical protein